MGISGLVVECKCEPTRGGNLPAALTTRTEVTERMADNHPTTQESALPTRNRPRGRHGYLTTIYTNREAVASGILQRTLPEPNSGCWLWMSCCDRHGYAKMNVPGFSALAHRISYEIFKGKIPSGLQLDHKCRVRCCVNPDHLEPVTNLENSIRGEAGSINAARQLSLTKCKHGHALSGGNIRISGNRRICKACARDKAKQAYRRKQAWPTWK